jgi:hypothetical protein
LAKSKALGKKGVRRSVEVERGAADETLEDAEGKKEYPSLSEYVSEAIDVRLRTLEEEKAGEPGAPPLEEDLLALRRTGLRWAILKCLHWRLTDVRFDIPQSVNGDLGVARSIIETGCSNLGTANGRLDWVEHALMAKAISLDNLQYWEVLLGKHHHNKLEKADIENMPNFETLVRQYPFIAYCMS